MISPSQVKETRQRRVWKEGDAGGLQNLIKQTNYTTTDTAAQTDAERARRPELALATAREEMVGAGLAQQVHSFPLHWSRYACHLQRMPCAPPYTRVQLSVRKKRTFSGSMRSGAPGTGRKTATTETLDKAIGQAERPLLSETCVDLRGSRTRKQGT